MITPASIGLPPKFTHFRDEVKQRETIESLATCGSRFLLLNAPPGTGKTVIGNSLGLLLGARYLYLTRTKSLQLQNYQDMSPIGLRDIVGHSNYPCSNVTYDDLGELADMECRGKRDGGCHYRPVVDLCLNSDQVSSNYSHWIQLYKSGDPYRLGTFDLLILDEAHLIRGLLAESASVKVFYSQVERYLGMRVPSNRATLDEWISWSMEAYRRASGKLDTLSEQKGASRRDLFYLSRLTDSLYRLGDEKDTADWVPVPIYDKGVQFKPCNVAVYSESYLFRGVPKILLMSATLFEDDADKIGIPNNDDSTYFSVESAFSYRRRPIIYFPTSPPVYVNRMNNVGKRLWINQIDKVLAFEGRSKGIIQSRSYDRADSIVSLSSKHGQMLVHDSSNATEIIERYKLSEPPCTIVSPILEEGVDFPYDLCSYIIIPKIPFLDMRNPYTKALNDRDKEYGNREVVRTIIQMALRGMRAKDDWCRIWVLDAHWSWLRKERWWYPWFRIAFRKIERLDQAPRRPRES